MERIEGGDSSLFDVPFLSKVVVRRRPGTWLTAGAHVMRCATTVREREVDPETLRCAHLTYPSLDRLRRKAALGANKALVIDTTAPTVTGVNSSSTNDEYKAGSVISIQVGFSEAVTVTGTPQLTLETGSTDRVANYSSGSGTGTLVFQYIVQSCAKERPDHAGGNHGGTVSRHAEGARAQGCRLRSGAQKGFQVERGVNLR